jgi:hypothetical protein
MTTVDLMIVNAALREGAERNEAPRSLALAGLAQKLVTRVWAAPAMALGIALIASTLHWGLQVCAAIGLLALPAIALRRRPSALVIDTRPLVAALEGES